ncbi:MAG: hypothetical protein M3N46_03405 [Actinomycetota bacterium]|nr:hypothetical protein [Actinomycetota bacterium]
MSDYTNLVALRDIVLEESWILEVAAQPGRMVFTADFVMTADHSEYVPPLPDEVFSYLRGDLIFSGVTNLEWTRQGDPPATDANGTVDWGHIDSMSYDDQLFQLHGDWGHIEVTARSVSVVPSATKTTMGSSG